MALKDKLVNLEDLAVLKEYSDDSFVKNKQGLSNKGKALIVDEDGNVTTGDATKVDPTFTQEGKAADAKATGEAVAKKMNKRLLAYDGTSFKLDGVVKTYAQIYDFLMNSPDFVVLVYSNQAYHPNVVSTEQIVFSSVYPSNGYTYVKRLTISSNNTITSTEARAEMYANKTGVINDSNKNDTEKYPSIKAVANYVDNGVGKDVNEIKTKLLPFFDEEGYLCILKM